MKRNLFGKVAVFSLAAMLGGAAFAQSTTQGSIAGTVEDATGAAIPNATVTIHNDGTNAEEHLTADSSGFFKESLLEPGTYTVKIAAASFESYRADKVVVQVGQTTNLMPHLTVGSTGETVEVSSEAPVLNFESPDFTTNINQAALANIPVNNRRWSALALTTPGVVSNSDGFGLVVARGISPILNNILIDGADDNQAYYAEERGRTREAYSTSGSAVREFAVNTGVYGAEYGRAAGTVINSVTKSGTNQLHGELYYYQRESKWAAYNDYTKLSVLNPTTGAYVSTAIKPEDLRKIGGFTVGGALVKDKIFWTYTFDVHHRAFPGIAIPASASTFYQLPQLSLNAGAVCNANGYLSGDTAPTAQASVDSQVCLLSVRQTAAGNATTYAQAASIWSSQIASLNSNLGNVPRFGNQEINTPKLDWQINSKNRVSFLYHRLRWDSPGGVQTQAALAYAVDSWGNDFVKLDYGLTKLTSIISSNISNELLYQYGRELNDESQQPFSPYTVNNLTANGNAVQVALATSIYANMGSEYYSYRKALPDERKWQIGDVLHWQHGNHNISAGGDVLRNADLINNTYESNGSYSYSYLGNYFNDLLNEKAGRANSCGAQTGQAPTTSDTSVPAGQGWTGALTCYGTFYQGFGNPVFGVATTDWSAFVQDNWKASPRLTLELGVRYEYEFLPSPVSNLIGTATGFTPYAQLANHPSDKNNAGIRAGFSFDAFGNGKTVVRGGYGMFYGRITNGVLLNVLLNTGSPNGQYTTSVKPTYTAPVPPSLPTLLTGASAPTPSSYFLAANLQNPMVHEFDLMVQQEIGKGTVFQVSYLGALGRELPNFLDLNLDPTSLKNVTITLLPYSNKYTDLGPAAKLGTVLNVPTYTAYGNVALFGPQAKNYQAISQVTSNVNSSYNAFVAEIQNRSLKSVEFDFNYTWSHSLDFNQQATTTVAGNTWYDPFGNAQINYGNSAYNVPNRLTGYVLYTVPGFKGNEWYTYLSNGWKVDTQFQMQSGLPYTAQATGFAGSGTSGGVVSDWNGAGGTTLIPGIGINTYKSPRKIVDDVRLEKDFHLYKNYNLNLFAQMFNIANHQNVDSVNINSTAYKLGGSGAVGTATFQNPTWQQVTGSNNSGFLYTPRQIEIAAKFVF